MTDLTAIETAAATYCEEKAYLDALGPVGMTPAILERWNRMKAAQELLLGSATEMAAELRELRERVASISEAAALVEKYVGCGDNSCMFVKPSGMATNGGCRCVERGTGRPFVAVALSKLYKAARSLTEKDPTP